MIVRALCSLALIALCAGPCVAQTGTPRAEPRMSRSPAFPSGPDIRARSIATCGPGERQCAIGGAIVWCCRADQQCSYSYPGACR